jgi:hypothetical protein
VAGGTAQPPEAWSNAEDFVRHHLRLAGHEGGEAPLNLIDFTVPWHVLSSILGGLAQNVFLKQFRDNVEPDGSCFRLVLTAPVEVTKLKGAPSLDGWNVTIAQLDSHPIITELGLASQTTHASFELEMDFILGAEQVSLGDLAVPVGGVQGTPWPPQPRPDSAAITLAPLTRVAAGAAEEARTATEQAWERFRAEHRG